MPTDPTIPVHFNFGEAGDGRNLIRYASGDSERLMLTEVGPDLYRLEESSFAGDAVYGDIIRADRSANGDLTFHGIVELSPLVTQSWILSADVLTTEHIRRLLSTVTAAGGMWEQAFGGLLMIHAPENIAKAIFDEIASLKGPS
jgi:hypothetical protein